MKYPVTAYAKALGEAITATEGRRNEEIIKNFLALVRKNGDEARLPKILHETEQFLREKDGTKQFVVESARPLEKRAEALFKGMEKPGDSFEEKIDPELIAGVKITVNGERQFDGSLKGKLDKLFMNI